MNSIETLKQELISQKNILISKGVTVTTAHTNPSPSEITAALQNMEIEPESFDFSGANASAQDVRSGKKFYNQTGELQTGSLDVETLENLSALSMARLTGASDTPLEIYIPSTISEIYDYAYYCEGRVGLFAANNLTIPSNIQSIGKYAFHSCALTGKVTVPNTCTSIGNSAFRYSTATEIEVNGATLSDYAFDSCPNLQKLTIYSNAGIIPVYFAAHCPNLREVYLYGISQLKTYLFTGGSVELVLIDTNETITTASATFNSSGTPAVAVRASKYNECISSPGFTKNCKLMGFQAFQIGDTLPSTVAGNLSVNWYSNYTDAKAETNPVNTCSAAGTYYCVKL